MHHPWRIIILGWLALLSLGIVGLIWLYSNVLPGILVNEKTFASPTPTLNADTNEPPAAESSVQSQLDDLSTRLAALELQATAAGKNTTTTVVKNTTITQPTSGKITETFLPIGGGSTDNRDWTTLTGAQIMFDPKKFGQIVSVRFEAAGYTIGGEVHARLIDITNNTIYYSTELMFNTNNPTWSRTAKFSIPTSPTTFQVQLRSTSGETANLQDSRLVIEMRN